MQKNKQESCSTASAAKTRNQGSNSNNNRSDHNNQTSNPKFQIEASQIDQITQNNNTSKFKRRGSTGTYISNKGGQQSSCYTNQSYTQCTDEINFYAKSRTFRTSLNNSIIQNPINASKINPHLIPYIETSSLHLPDQSQQQQQQQLNYESYLKLQQQQQQHKSSSSNNDNYQKIEVDNKRYKGQQRTPSTQQLFEFSQSGGIQPWVRKPLMKRSISLKSGKFMSFNNGSMELGPIKYQASNGGGDQSLHLINKLNAQINSYSQQTNKLRGIISQLEKQKKELQSRLEQRIVTFTVKEAKWNKEKEALVDKLEKQDLEISDMRAHNIELQKKIQIKEYFAQNNLYEQQQQKRPPASAGGAFSVMSGRRSSAKYTDSVMMSPTNQIPKPPQSQQIQNSTLASSTQATSHYRKSSIQQKDIPILAPLWQAQQSSSSSSHAFMKRNSIKSPPTSPHSNNFPNPAPPSTINLKRNSMVTSPQRYNSGSNTSKKYDRFQGRSSISYMPDQVSKINSPTNNTNRPMIRKYARAIKKLQLQKKVHSVSGNGNNSTIRERNASIGAVIPGGIIIPSQHSSMMINQGSQSYSINPHNYHHHHHHHHQNNSSITQDSSSYQNQTMFNESNQIGGRNSNNKGYFNHTAGFGNLNASKRSASITPTDTLQINNNINSNNNNIAHSSMVNLKSGRYDNDNEEDQYDNHQQEQGDKQQEQLDQKPFASVRLSTQNKFNNNNNSNNNNKQGFIQPQSPQFFSRQRLIKANKQHSFFSPQRNNDNSMGGQYSFQVIRKAPNLINVHNANNNIGRHQTPKIRQVYHHPHHHHHQQKREHESANQRGGSGIENAPQPGNNRPVFTRQKLYQNLVERSPNNVKDLNE